MRSKRRCQAAGLSGLCCFPHGDGMCHKVPTSREAAWTHRNCLPALFSHHLHWWPRRRGSNKTPQTLKHRSTLQGCHQCAQAAGKPRPHTHLAAPLEQQRPGLELASKCSSSGASTAARMTAWAGGQRGSLSRLHQRLDPALHIPRPPRSPCFGITPPLV